MYYRRAQMLCPQTQGAELKLLCEAHGLKKSGKVAELMLRLAINEIERTGPTQPVPAPATAPAPASAPASKPKDKKADLLHGFDFTVRNEAEPPRPRRFSPVSHVFMPGRRTT